MDRRDIEELRALVPPPREEPLSPERLARRKETLMREVTRTYGPENKEIAPAQTVPRRRRGRSRVAALILVPAALLGGAVAYSLNANRTASQLGDEVTCFQEPSLGADAAGAPFSGQDLAAFCDQQWNSGSLAAPPPGPAPASWVACESAGGGVDVFPSRDPELCQSLGLEPVPPTYYQTVRRYSGMESDLTSQFPETQCMNAHDGIATTRRVLDAHGYTEWTIQTSGFARVTPCALTPDLDPVNGVATIMGGVRPELRAAVQRGLDQANDCGPEAVLLGDVQESLAQAGFGTWTVRIDHALTTEWPCVAGFNEEPATRTIVLTGHASS